MRSGKWRVLLAVGAMLTASLVATAAAGAQEPDAAGGDYVIVTLNGAAAAHDDTTKTQGRFDPTSQGYARALDRMQRQHDRFVSRLATVAPDAEVVDHFFVTANAVVVKLNGSDLNKITTISGVERTQSSTLYQLDMNESVHLINVVDYWGVVGRADAGDGINVGVIDSGIDPGHPFFACKEIGFGGIYYSGQGILPQVPSASAIFGPGYTPGPGDPLYFSSEHGTHVAGTIGGCVTTINFPLPTDTVTLSGVAPGVNLFDYNVFPYIGAGMVAFGGSAFSHDIADAIEDAVLDGMHVINMSLSGGVQGPHDFLAEVSNAAAEAGVVVVAATGNDDPGLYQVGSPASGSEVIGVGATTNAHELIATVTTSGGQVYRAAVGEFPDFDGLPHDLEDWSGSDNQACTGVGADVHTGDIVIISRGTCSFSQKVAVAHDAGAYGVIVYNNVADADPFPMGRTAGFDDLYPAVMVSLANGLALETEADAAATTAVVTPRRLGPAVPNLLTDFSNIGPAPFTHIVKPDVVAPGQSVLSSVFTLGSNLLPTNRTYDLFNGTSMATPHVSGAAAILVAEGRVNREVKSALVTTAVDLGYEVWEQGGGLIDVVAAVAAQSFFYPSSASFGVFKGNAPANGTLAIEISGNTCSSASVAGGGGFVTADVDGTTLEVEFAGGRTAGTGFYSGYVTVTCTGGTYDLPFLAVVDR
ncbi:MAG TPA: hypothetical protein DCY40_03925 [Actinobacteria bacterium]|nr:hypothetical protein [Actinomycetota bacterium]